jgi:hypothetical protein
VRERKPTGCAAVWGGTSGGFAGKVLEIHLWHLKKSLFSVCKFNDVRELKDVEGWIPAFSRGLYLNRHNIWGQSLLSSPQSLCQSSETNKLYFIKFPCGIWCSQYSGYKQFYFLGHNAVQFVESQRTFRRSMSPLRWKNKQCSSCYLLQAGFFAFSLFSDLEDGGNMFLRNVCWLSIYFIIFQKIKPLKCKWFGGHKDAPC